MIRKSPRGHGIGNAVLTAGDMNLFAGDGLRIARLLMVAG